MNQAKTFELPVEILRSTGLNGIDRVFLACLYDPTANAQTLSELTGVPKNQVIAARCRLRDKGVLIHERFDRWSVA